MALPRRDFLKGLAVSPAALLAWLSSGESPIPRTPLADVLVRPPGKTSDPVFFLETTPGCPDLRDAARVRGFTAVGVDVQEEELEVEISFQPIRAWETRYVVDGPEPTPEDLEAARELFEQWRTHTGPFAL